MQFEWDEGKNRINKRKHGVAFEEAQTVFFDTLYIDGSATASHDISSVTINGEPVMILPGRTVYFGELVDLAEGETARTLAGSFAGHGRRARSLGAARSPGRWPVPSTGRTASPPVGAADDPHRHQRLQL